jgi:rhodanese-related sulfurtransferase
MTKSISAEELRESIKNKKDNIEMIDVRQPEEYEEFHIEGAKLIPLGELSKRKNEIDWNKEIIFMCQSGARSGIAANTMSALGGNINNLEGGILTWQKLG